GVESEDAWHHREACVETKRSREGARVPIYMRRGWSEPRDPKRPCGAMDGPHGARKSKSTRGWRWRRPSR
ncbi:unnamed protein product, partial [Urochloa humidicola]